MAVSIYLSNNTIRAVVGTKTKDRIKIEEQILKEIPEGSLINGVITNPQELEQELSLFFKEKGLSKKEVYLVVHSSRFVNKQISLPKVKKSRIEEMVIMEFADVERYSDAVYDYAFMKENGKSKENIQDILAVMADRDFVKGYVEIFENIGIKLAGFSNAMSAEVHVFSKLEQLKNESCIIHILDGNNMESVIWVNGEFKQSTNRRLFNKVGSREFATEVVRHTSTSLQFYESLRLSGKLTKVYLCGATQAEIDLYNKMSQEIGLSLKISYLKLDQAFTGLKPQERISDFVYPIGGLIKKEKEIDFLKLYKKENQDNEKREALIKSLMPVAIVLGICLIAMSASGIFYGVNKGKVKKLDAYLNKLANIEKMKEADKWEKKIDNNNLIIKDLKNVKEMVASYPLINNSLSQLVESVNTSAVSGTIINYNAKKGTLTIEARANEVTMINSYVAALKNTKAFDQVEYTGYSFNSNENYYSINVVGHLNEEAGR